MVTIGPPRLIIFDMDRTLVDVSKCHLQAYLVAVKSVYGFDDGLDPQQDAGQTQPNIMRRISRAAGIPAQEVEAKLPEALSILSDVTIFLLDPDLRPNVLPGVPVLLTALQQYGHYLAVATGTICATTDVILARSGLAGYFDARACGDEAEWRPEVLLLAGRRALQEHAALAEPATWTVLGDTPSDVSAARAIGARAIAVASGHHSRDALASCKPDALLDDLSDLDAALRSILGTT
jgi:phosphoglycolate phosphatase